MRDFSKATCPRKKKVPANRVKVQRKPLNLKKYLRPLKNVTLGLEGLILIFAVLYFAKSALGSITFFRVKSVEVSSCKRLSRDEILAMAGVEPGRDLLRMNLKRMGEQIRSEEHTLELQ